ncbi:MAG: hypothetical protein K0T99_00390 [Alphaproteobacteria bacterium]|nr:hypothetical protein [Alphaproteobacteria bacterium]
MGRLKGKTGRGKVYKKEESPPKEEGLTPEKREKLREFIKKMQEVLEGAENNIAVLRSARAAAEEDSESDAAAESQANAVAACAGESILQQANVTGSGDAGNAADVLSASPSGLIQELTE